MRSKVSNRNGTFVGFEGVTGVAEIPIAPFVSNRKAGVPTDFDHFEASGLLGAESGANAVRREPEWKKVVRVCEAP
jgi:hypothetical protein